MRQWLIDNFPAASIAMLSVFARPHPLKKFVNKTTRSTPGRYVGVSFDVEDLNDFRESMTSLKSELSDLNDSGKELMSRILSNLSQLGI